MRTVKFEGIENFRDLGGYPCSFGETSFGTLFRSATLAYATKADVDKMAEIGIRSVLDLREDKAKKEFPDPVVGDERFVYVSLSVNGAGRIPTSEEDQLDSYMEMLEDPYSARKVFQAILNAPKPLVFHCNAGKDRTGCFSMVLLLAAGVAEEDVNADYMLSFPLLPKMARETWKNMPEHAPLLATPKTDFLPRLLERFYKRYGSVPAYFETIGLSEDEIKGIENLLGKREKSCGAVLFYQNKVLVEHMRKGHYSIPKGHVEPVDKDEHATAEREIKEETRLSVDHFIPGFRETIVYSPKPGVIKEVVFFLAEAKSGIGIPQPEEVESLLWLTPADCMMVLSHDSDRKIVKDASFFYADMKS